jgi:hypothetical protein
LILLCTFVVLATLSVVLAAACGDEPAVETPTPQTAAADTPAPADSTPTRKPLPEGYDPNEAMFGIYGGPRQSADMTLNALRSILDAGDTSQVAVIVEFTRFISDPVLAAIAQEVLRQLTGQEFGLGGEGWFEATEWLGKRRDEYPPPSDYLRWKINLLSAISDRYKIFLGDAATTARIDITELVWGGVRPDGIPDLQFAPTLTADEADYLGSDERVFGVSINGEHRAYPLRIMNPHEMANDIVGGEPIALAY